MKFYPCNRHLLLEPRVEPGSEEPTVLLPAGYSPAQKEFGAYMVVTSAPDCSLNTYPGDMVLVENSMVREIKFEGEVYAIILENYVCGYLSTEWREDED